MTCPTAEKISSYVCPWTGIPYWLAALAIAALVILWMLVSCRRKHRPLRVIHDDSGEAFVAIGALNDLIHLVCEKIGAAGRPRIAFQPKGELLNVRVRLKLYENQRLEDMRQQLRECILETFRDTHGIQVGEVSIIVTGFKKRRDTMSDAADHAGDA